MPTRFSSLHAALDDYDSTYEDVVERLQAGDDPAAPDQYGVLPIEVALRRRRLDVASLLLTHGAEIKTSPRDGMHPIHHIGFWDDTEFLDWLLRHGVDINTKVERIDASPDDWRIGRTALHFAADDRSLVNVEFLLAHGADPNIRDETDGFTPLHLAVRGYYGPYKRLTRMLIDGGADVDIQDARGMTALHHVCEYAPRHYRAVLKLLVHRGARVDLKDATGRTPRDYLMEVRDFYVRKIGETSNELAPADEWVQRIARLDLACEILLRAEQSAA